MSNGRCGGGVPVKGTTAYLSSRYTTEFTEEDGRYECVFSVRDLGELGNGEHGFRAMSVTEGSGMGQGERKWSVYNKDNVTAKIYVLQGPADCGKSSAIKEIMTIQLTQVVE